MLDGGTTICMPGGKTGCLSLPMTAPNATNERTNEKQRRHERDDREDFAKFSRSFREVSRSFCKFFEVFVASGTCLDLFGPARMRSDAIGCIRKRSDGRVRATYRRSHRRRKSPKCALSSRLVVCCLLFVCSSGKNQHRLRR